VAPISSSLSSGMRSTNNPLRESQTSRSSTTTSGEQLGRMAAERGMRLCYHHHIGTGVMSRADIDRLMATTDPVAVFLLLDTGHLYWAGDDPLSLAKAYADRIKHVHLKDIRPDVIGRSAQHNLNFEESIREGVFTVPGDGAIEFKPILQVLADYGHVRVGDGAGWHPSRLGTSIHAARVGPSLYGHIPDGHD
jgi:inosose dehydratase